MVKVSQDYLVADVQNALKQALPTDLSVRTRAEFIALEVAFQNDVSPVGPIFMLGTVIGFVVGLMISYQILYTELSEQEAQYATLKAMGYENCYLVRVVLTQSALYGIAGFLAAWAAGLIVFKVIGEKALLPMHMSPGIALGTAALTVGMCLLAGALAVRRVIDTDPAEIFG